MHLLTAFLAIGLACIHLLSGKLNFLDAIPRSRWLSSAGGVSVAYVFIHLLPELSERQHAFDQVPGVVTYLENHIYLVALVGLSVFYGLERAALRSRRSNRRAGKEDATGTGVFWIHIFAFTCYNALIGYLLVQRQEAFLSTVLYAIAMGLHFVVNDHGLRENHKRDYDRIGRWILAIAIVIGFVIGQATKIDDLALSILFAFLAGGVILNILKEELPEERESRFWAFALGAISYTMLLLLAD